MKGHVLYALVYGRRAERASPQRTRKQMGGSWGGPGGGSTIGRWGHVLQEEKVCRGGCLTW